MANDIQSAFKEVVATPSPNKWMLFVAIGFLAGAVFGSLLNLNAMAKAQAKEDCGICQENVKAMVHNFNVLAKSCNEAIPYQRNISILPAIGWNQTVSVYAS